MEALLLAGPTASGKSDLALELGARFNIEIVSADAMQVYRHMDIGTAKPTHAERTAIPHHLIDVVAPDEPFSVAAYVALAHEAIKGIVARGRIPLVVGGTGFYIRALSEGLPRVPPADREAQAALWRRLEREGLEALLRELAALSPIDAARAGRNPRRVVRSLEVIERTGTPPSAHGKEAPGVRLDKVVLMPDPSWLKERIIRRTDRMFSEGLVAEVRTIRERYPELPTSRQAIGYKEVHKYLAGELTLAEAKEEVVRATVRYASRQRTWFRREPLAQLVGTANEAVRILETAMSRIERG